MFKTLKNQGFKELVYNMWKIYYKNLFKCGKQDRNFKQREIYEDFSSRYIK